uniref:Uncharacterized protein n=1 Tax=Myotis myotis TaxID=51298 RepID=A0A7J7T641_MYOMY|nr:hypothetical protein mMyoMyo1_009245 [Myotis myotis]
MSQNCSAADVMPSWDCVYVRAFTAQHRKPSLSKALSPLRARVAAVLRALSFPLPPRGFPLMSLLLHSGPKGQHPLSLHCALLPVITSQQAARERVGGSQWRCQMLGSPQKRGGPVESHLSHFQLCIKWKFL